MYEKEKKLFICQQCAELNKKRECPEEAKDNCSLLKEKTIRYDEENAFFVFSALTQKEAETAKVSMEKSVVE